MISCILLTAGESKRFGSPKALADIQNQKTIQVLQEKLIQSLIDEIIIVTGAFENLINPYVLNHSKVRVVHNKDYKLGQTSSFQTGLNIVDKNSKGIMLLPIDCPFILTTSIDTLICYFRKHVHDILIPSYQEKKGHPPILNAKLKNEILNLPPNKGLNSLIKLYQTKVLEINDPGIIQSFNTKEELEKIVTGTN